MSIVVADTGYGAIRECKAVDSTTNSSLINLPEKTLLFYRPFNEERYNYNVYY